MYKITAKLLVVCTMYNSVYIVPVVDMDSGHAALIEQMDICLQFTCTLSEKVRFYTVDLVVWIRDIFVSLLGSDIHGYIRLPII